MDKQDLLDDLAPPSISGDKVIDNLYAQLLCEHVQKGIPYVEPMRSKFFGHLKYLMVIKGRRDIVVVDLDTNQETRLM